MSILGFIILVIGFGVVCGLLGKLFGLDAFDVAGKAIGYSFLFVCASLFLAVFSSLF